MEDGYSASELDDSGVRGENRCGDQCNPNPFVWLIVAALSTAFLITLVRDFSSRGWRLALSAPSTPMALIYYLGAIGSLCLIGRWLSLWLAGALALLLVLQIYRKHRSIR